MRHLLRLFLLSVQYFAVFVVTVMSPLVSIFVADVTTQRTMAQSQGIHFGVDVPEPPLGTPLPPRGQAAPGYPLLDDALNAMHRQECDFVCLPLMKTHEFEPFGRSQRLLKVTSWCSMVVGKASTWHGDKQLDCDSTDPVVAELSCDTLRREINYAAHSTLPAVMIELPKKPSPNLARILISCLLKSMYLNIWVRVPLCQEGSVDAENNNESWLLWNSLRSLCHNHNRLNVILEFTRDLPNETIMNRWVAEPIRGLMLDLSLFSTTERCSLPKKHLHYLMLLHKHKSQVIFKGKMPQNLQKTKEDLRYFKNFVLNTKAQIAFSPQEKEEMPFHDYLQAPLQPLMDNLESQTYEVFEKDPIKYARYEEAATLALQDLTNEFPDRQLVVMIVGAGRGPLVKGAMHAAKKVGANVKVYAVEKNPNAIVTLRGMLREKDWQGQVEIVESDMRVWKAPDEADLIISELLGSFGDNELSPECLDGAERFLRKGGIMIPESYRSFLAPLQSHKLHTDVLAYDDLTHIETPYVVKIHSGHLIAPAKQCFEYIHPKPALPYPQSNDRMITIEFDVCR